MPDIAWPVSSRPGPSPDEGAGRAINAYAEEVGEGGRNPVSLRRVPGLARFASIGRSTLRGARMAGGRLLAAFEDRLVAVNASGAVADIGPLPGSERITLARNNRAPTPQVVMVTEYGAYQVGESGAPEPLPIPSDLPMPNSVEFLLGWFFFTAGDGTAYATTLNDTTFNAQDYTKEQGRSAGLLRAIGFRSELFLFGPQDTGVYGRQSEKTGFPLARVTGIPRGLIGPWAVAGHEDGWSNELIWVADDAVVYRLDGYSPRRISNHDVERDLARAAKVDPRLIEASVYLVAGHAFWVVSMPGQTWVYDLTTGAWHERVSLGSDRWRGSQSVKAYGRWLVGDRQGTALLEVREDIYDEVGAALVMRIESLPGEAFPQRLAIPRADFDFVVGQGRASGPANTVDPVVLVSWSDDGGRTFSNPLTRRLGRLGERRARVNVLRTGMTGVQGRVWRIVVSDPVYVALLGGAAAIEARTE